MDIQTIFTQVIQHLARQRKSAINGDNHCQYRATCGDRCAVGYLIPAWLYSHEIEGDAASDIEVQAILRAAHGVLTTRQRMLLDDLQSWHDGELDLLSQSQKRLPINLDGNNKVSARRDQLISRLEYLAKTYEVIIPRAFYDWMAEVNDE